jgi:hypothetical protein
VLDAPSDHRKGMNAGFRISRDHARDIAAVASLNLGRVTVPTLIVAHAKDGCAESPPSGAGKLKARLTKASKVEIVMLEGGKRPRSKPCEARAQHGYYGIEKQAVESIATFIKANSK